MADLQQIVQRMVEAGESEADIALVIQQYKASTPTPTETPAPDERSLGGFAGNVVKSGGRFIGDIAQTVLHPIDTAKALGTAVMNPIDTASAIGSGLKERYGGLQNIGTTLYEDPVGVLADVSSLAGVGAAARVPKIAGTLRKLEAATNPARIIGRPIAAGADKLSSAVIKGTLRPSAAIRGDFGGAKAIADTVKKERVFSEASSQKKLREAGQAGKARIAQAKAEGVEGPSRFAVADAARNKPGAKAAMRARLGEPDQTDVLEARAKMLEGEGGTFDIADAQNLKQEAQELAFEAGADNLSVKKLQEQEIARALREGIEQQVPDMGPLNQRTQGLMGTTRAFTEAQDRPNALSNMLAIGTGATVGGNTGDIASAIASAALMKALNSPRVGALAGIGLNEAGKAAINPRALQAALIARLLGQDDQQ